MDPLLVTIWLRMAERFASVVVGGLALYFGYSLFLRLPDVKDSTGAVKWRDPSVVLSRIVPGVFFALFGTILTLASFYNPITYAPVVAASAPIPTPAGGSSGLGDTPIVAGAGEEYIKPSSGVLPIEIRNDIALLNGLEGRMAEGLTDKDQRNFDLAVPRIKLLLLASVWDETKWDDEATFRRKVLDNDIDCTNVEKDSPEELFCYGTP